MTYSYAAARSAPLLEWEDERLLIEGWQRRQDADALEALVISHARIVHFWARKLSRDATEQEELVSEGILGLIRAADMFDVGRDVRFSTYARWWVKNSVLTALDRLRSVVESPANVPQQKSRSIEDEDQSGGLVSDDPTPEEHLIAKSSHDAMCRRIIDAMTGLDEIDREVLTCRSLKQPPDTISDLAARLGVNTTKLRQLERRAMARLKYELMARGVMTSRV